ncbi:LpxI family protein [Aureliella helgolandensis]|uniref:UDP-2,3-diacylglucosamine pyrophosphatase LpxI n=1 Tax=Aureliella helgolandensis TaxID=2527968 RepID=A0A518G7B8_9BACT|nr:UDP-2,3-diacylglucosamine diphosphatase LpxI [Aureliella helgolandensis]QDV24485.1 hypothetical protein Q31a_28030 [Aureliella helgolandensis]
MERPTDNASLQTSADTPKRVGIIAGWGSFPVEVAQRFRDQGYEVYVAALKGHADERLEEIATKVKWCGVLKLGAQMRFFTQHRVPQIALAGKIFKDRIMYHGYGWIQHFPDLTCLRMFASNFITRTRDACDDTLMSKVVSTYLQRGIEVLSITQIAPHLLAEGGCLTRRKLSRSQNADIQFGWKIARSMGGLDIGQSITVQEQVVLGVEAVEGTDALIARTGNLCPRGGFTLIKVAKPNQDLRFDVPTIGMQTIERMAAAGGTAIAIEAGKTIFVDREATLALANRKGIAIISLVADEIPAAPTGSGATAGVSHRSEPLEPNSSETQIPQMLRSRVAA